MIPFAPGRRQTRFPARLRPKNRALCPLTGEEREKALAYLAKHGAPRPVIVGERFEFFPRSIGRLISGVWLGGDKFEVGVYR